MLASTTLSLLFATLVAAGPVAKRFPSTFHVIFSIDQAQSTFLSANAVKDITTDEIILVGERLSAYPGSDAYTVTDSEGGQALNFDLDGHPDPTLNGIYGATVPSVGDNYGFAGAVTAATGFEDYNWAVRNGTIYHTLEAGTNSFFACQKIVNDEESTVLSFGAFQENTQPPEGCVATVVKVDSA